MEHYGLLGIIPPLLAIILALVTKEVIISLTLGILSGTLIIAHGNLFTAITIFTDKVAEMSGDAWNIRILLFCALLGAFVSMLSKTGATKAFGLWASKYLKTKKSILIFTWFFGLIIFIDDYFNSLSVGTVMRPAFDQNKISRAKLAYILDSTAAPVCILAPISTWVVTVMSYIRDSEGFESLNISEFVFFIKHTSRTTARRILNEHIKISEVKKIKFHGLRHSMASRMINKGCNPLIVSKHLRHSSTQQTLDTYSHLFPNITNGIMDKI